LYKEEKIMDLVDKNMCLDADEELEVQRVINIALLCLQQSHENRPTMGEVMAMLQGDHFNLAVAELETTRYVETSSRSKLAKSSSLGSTVIKRIDKLPLLNDEGTSSSSNFRTTLELQKVKGR
jgi:hypothetical protein